MLERMMMYEHVVSSRVVKGCMVVLTLTLALSACSGGGAVDVRAERFASGTLSSFGGANGADPDSRDIARDIATGRFYDFTPTGYVIADGAAASTPASGSSLGDGTGTVAVSGDTVTVDMDVASELPLEAVHMTGSFSLADATLALSKPGASFSAVWQITWSALGTDFALSAEQQLTGTDFAPI
jgi:hypothetical protein